MKGKLYFIANHILENRNYNTLNVFECIRLKQFIIKYELENEEYFNTLNLLINKKYKELTGKEYDI